MFIIVSYRRSGFRRSLLHYRCRSHHRHIHAQKAAQDIPIWPALDHVNRKFNLLTLALRRKTNFDHPPTFGSKADLSLIFARPGASGYFRRAGFTVTTRVPSTVSGLSRRLMVVCLSYGFLGHISHIMFSRLRYLMAVRLRPRLTGHISHIVFVCLRRLRIGLGFGAAGCVSLRVSLILGLVRMIVPGLVVAGQTSRGWLRRHYHYLSPADRLSVGVVKFDDNFIAACFDRAGDEIQFNLYGVSARFAATIRGAGRSQRRQG
jgi:hypothetical protein